MRGGNEDDIQVPRHQETPPWANIKRYMNAVVRQSTSRDMKSHIRKQASIPIAINLA